MNRGPLLLGLLLSLCPLTANAKVVETSAGLIEGRLTRGVYRFMGVPYAAPPIGDLRWRAPQPAAPWTGIRPAYKPASACAQYGNFFASSDAATFDKPHGSEDCLYLNIWAPQKFSAKRPVLIFFHGGSGIAGDAAHPLYDGAKLATALDAVVITTNYRLSVFGSLQSEALRTGDPAEDSGSYYLLDLIQVLDWTRNNCVGFGCDGGNITIAGQSAGAVNVLSLLRSPLAKGKFQKAISLSGVPFSGSWEQAKERTQELLSNLLIADGQAADKEQAQDQMQTLNPDDLREYLYAQPMHALVKASGRGLSPVALADGVVLKTLDAPESPAPQVVSKVPLLMGKTRDELTTLIPLFETDAPLVEMWPYYSGEPRQRSIKNELGWFKRIKRGTTVFFADRFLRRKFKRFTKEYGAQLPALYVYQFEWDNYPEPWRSDLGAFHGLDIPFVFGNFIDDRKIYMRFAWTEENRNEREALHRHIAESLKAFVHKGAPSTPAQAKQPWPQWQDGSHIEIWDSPSND